MPTLPHIRSLFSKLFLSTFKLLIIILLVYVVYLNLKLHHSPNFTEDDHNADVVEQLAFLEGELHAGAAHRMQQLFPEGHLFSNVLYGLAWADVGQQLPTGKLKTKALQEIDWALAEIHSPTGVAVFPKDLPLPNGIFYQGWSTYLLGKKIALQDPQERDSTTLQQYRNQIEQIAIAFSEAKSPFLESYHGASWPADNVVGMAAIMAADRFWRNDQYSSLKSKWLEKVNQRLDPHTHLIPHQTDPYNGEMLEGARGSSQSLMLCFLPEIDAVFAKAQYELYQENFVTSRLGLTGIREYPKGLNGTGDIDSGPVIWGIGGAASVVGQRAAGLNNQPNRFVELRNTFEAFGMANTWTGKKRFLFGQLTVADAFISWSNGVEQRSQQFPPPPWPWKFHFLSLIIVLILGWLLRKL